ncbi:zinc finger CCCH domain-containing protein 23 [Humulus lupulus]|uniref:zinc finger CCCH domain-containing protein 23 n=1 Tax=Humulus lupulus TaxID=3486 RepID=UPI002B410275|nr:zinc finger CCCH domain-containing protein 23 [Humulus lupulus]
MMIGEQNRLKPTVQIPQWDPYEDPTAGLSSPLSLNSPSVNHNSNVGTGDFYHFLEKFSSLHRYLPSNEFLHGESDSLSEELDVHVDSFSCDHFRMFEFKVRRCGRSRSHDWTECPFAHPGEKARRRDPRKHHYSGTACPEFRKGNCRNGDSCEFAHGVFECWLHPARYRTQPCKDGLSCRRRVCFFAHTAEQLRVLAQQSPRTNGPCESYDGSPIRHTFDSYLTKGAFLSSPTSILTSPPLSPPSDSPPASPNSLQIGGGTINSSSELLTSMRNLHLGKIKMSSSAPWGFQMGSGFISPRGGSMLRPGFCSVPSTPTRNPITPLLGSMDPWEQTFEEEPKMERVESGKNIRAIMYAKLSKENSLGRGDSVAAAPDVGWISELVN